MLGLPKKKKRKRLTCPDKLLHKSNNAGQDEDMLKYEIKYKSNCYIGTMED